jgi:6-phosphogluconolactonase
MLRRALTPALETGAALLSMVGTSSTLEHAADDADVLYGRQHIDIALMGMGEDGHTASWFPGVADEALRSHRTVVAVHASNASASPERLTLTHAAIAKADAIVLLIAGDTKRARLDAALHASVSQAPVAALFADARQPDVFWSP